MTPITPGMDLPNDEFDDVPLHDDDLVLEQDLDDR